MVKDIEKLEKKLRKNPEDRKLLVMLGNEYLNRGSWNQAEFCYKRLVEFEPDSAFFLSQLGAAIAKQGRYRAALRYLKKAVAIDRNCCDAQFVLGLSYVHLYRFAQAIEPLEQAIWLNATIPYTYIWLGDAYRGLYLPEIAVDYYNKGLAIDPAALSVSLFREEFEGGESA